MRDKLLKTLLVLSLTSVLSGCDMITDPGTSSSPEGPRGREQTKYYALPKDIQSKAAEAQTAIGDAIQMLKQPSNEVTKDTLTPKVNSALSAFQTLTSALDAPTAPPEIKNALSAVKTEISESATQIGEAQKILAIKKVQKIGDTEHAQISAFLTTAQKQFTSAKNELMKLDNRPYTVQSDPSPAGPSTITKWLPLVGYVLGAIILVVILIFAARRAASSFWSAVDSTLR